MYHTSYYGYFTNLIHFYTNKICLIQLSVLAEYDFNQKAYAWFNDLNVLCVVIFFKFAFLILCGNFRIISQPSKIESIFSNSWIHTYTTCKHLHAVSPLIYFRCILYLCDLYGFALMNGQHIP